MIHFFQNCQILKICTTPPTFLYLQTVGQGQPRPESALLAKTGPDNCKFLHTQFCTKYFSFIAFNRIGMNSHKTGIFCKLKCENHHEVCHENI